MRWTINDSGSQAGRLAVVTGANIGLGYETALALAGRGCAVVLACRNLDKAKAASARLRAQHSAAEIECIELDLTRLKSVHHFATTFAKRYQSLDLLINNAGIMMPPYALSEDGFESQLAANYLGHFAMTGLMLPLLANIPGSRIVSLSSLAHKWGEIRLDDPQFEKGYSRYAAYCQSKLACLIFSYELNRRLQAAGIKTLSVAAHPGVAATNLAHYFPKFLSIFFPLVCQSAADGALPTLYAALGSDINGGDYCGPRSMGQMRGAPIKVGSNRRSRDEATAKKLWRMSEQLSHVQYRF